MIGNALARHGSTVMVTAALELAHVQLARRRAALRSVGLAVDHQRARPADAFAAVVVEHDRVLALADQTFVEDVEQLEKRRLLADLGDRVVLEMTLGGRDRPDARSAASSSSDGSLVAPGLEVHDLELERLDVADRRRRDRRSTPRRRHGRNARHHAALRHLRTGARRGSGHRSSPRARGRRGTSTSRARRSPRRARPSRASG